MLPGIRFLCAAIVLAVSLVIFGMGAAALLRSAHEEFASLPNRRPPPATVFSRQPEPVPTLAMLRLEPRVPDIVEPPVLAPAVQASEPAPVAPAEAEVKLAPEPATMAAVVPAMEPESSAIVEAPPVTPGEPATVTVAALPEIALEPTAAPQQPAAPEITSSISLPTATIMELPTATLTEEDAKLSSSKVAVLGGPPIDTAPVPLPHSRPAAEPPKVKPVKKVVKKPAVKRRVATRAAPMATSAAQQQQDPFGLSQLR